MPHHSDRGSQYASDACRELLRRHGAMPSMSRAANCYDNAKVESFWATLKGELIGDRVFATRAQARSKSSATSRSSTTEHDSTARSATNPPVDFENQLS